VGTHHGGASTAATVSANEVDAVLTACRVLVAVSARSIASVADDGIDVPQFRALVIVASRRAVSLGELATSAGLNLSTASRMCDRLVGMNLLHRTEDPANRRQLVLTLTDQGRRIVSRVTRRRRAAIEPMLRKLPKARRALLVELLEELASASGVPAERDLWAMGWTS
jgi:DNA-binding MarR family transcriptional regulator